MAPVAVSPQPLAAVTGSVPHPRSALKRNHTDAADSARSPTSPRKHRKSVVFAEGTYDETASEPEETPSRPKESLNEFQETVNESDEVLNDPEEKDVTLILEEVKYALQDWNGRGKDTFAQIKEHFDIPPQSKNAPSSSLLTKYLIALHAVAPWLTKACSDLVTAVLRHQWLSRDDHFASIHIRFQAQLVSSQTGYLAGALAMLVENFAHLSTSAGRVHGLAVLERQRLQAKVHTAIKLILQAVPSATSSLSSIISSTFPFPTDTRKAHVEYVRNLLQLIEYAPELKADILDVTTDRLIKIDVQVQTDIEDLEEDIDEMLEHGQTLPGFHQLGQDGDTFGDSDSEPGSDNEYLDADELRVKNLKSTVDKMDAILDLLFQYYDPIFSKGNHFDSSSTFEQLLSQFRKSILSTYRSRHTQFLLFRFAQTTPEFAIRFVDLCRSILIDKSRPSMLRVSAAAYIASFIARASQTDATVVCYTFDILGAYLDILRKEYERKMEKLDMRRHSVYYATAQALIYIFCFRWRDLIVGREDYEDEDDEDLLSGPQLTWTPGVRDALSSNIYSPLNPLKICAPEIIEEFVYIAYRTGLMYLYPKMNENKTVRLAQNLNASYGCATREGALASLHGERHQQLDAYFPFDPYRLPLSKRWISDAYLVWKAVPEERQQQQQQQRVVTEQDSSEDEADVEDEAEMDEMDHLTATPVPSDDHEAR